MNAEDIVKRFALLEGERKNVESIWEDIERFIMPFRGEFFRDMKSEGEVNWRKRQVYDSTAIQAAQNLAASIQSNIMNPATKWFNFEFREKELQDDDAAQEWLDTCTEIVYYDLVESDLNKEAAEAITDMVGFGTAIIIEEERDEGLDFTSVPIREAYFEENSDGGIYNLYRILRWTAIQIQEFFVKGDYKATNLPEAVQAKLATTEAGTTKFDIVFCIFRRDEIEKDPSAKVLGPKARPYGSMYVMRTGAEMLGAEGGYYEQPAFAPRWRTTAGSKWGHSPGTVALADIMTLNEITETTLEAAAKAVDPPLVTTQRGVMSDVDLSRGGLTVLRNIDDLAPFNTNARIDWGHLEIDRLQQSINRSFFVDQLELKESPAMTATEVQVRYELMQRLLGPTLGHLVDDFLNPAVSRAFNIAYRAGRLPEPPKIVLEVGSKLDIEYTGPMARSHKQEQVISTTNWMSQLAEYAQVDPTVLDVVDTDKMPRELGHMGGVPAVMMRSKDEVADIRTKREEQMKAAQEAENAKNQGQGQKAAAEGEAAMQEAGNGNQ